MNTTETNRLLNPGLTTLLTPVCVSGEKVDFLLFLGL